MKEMTGRQILDAIETGLQEVGRKFEQAEHKSDRMPTKGARRIEAPSERRATTRRQA